LVTKYRRAVLTDAMLTFCEQAMRTACDELDAELVEFNGEPDHIHLLVYYPPTLAIATPLQRLKTRSGYGCAPRVHQRWFPRSDARTPLVAVLLRCLLPRRAVVDHQAVHRQSSPAP